MKSEKNKTYIIAELGVNHNGSLSLAKKMIYNAKTCGADAIKLQSYISSEITSYKALTADYQSKKKLSQIEMLSKYELSTKQQVFCGLISILLIITIFIHSYINYSIHYDS